MPKKAPSKQQSAKKPGPGTPGRAAHHTVANREPETTPSADTVAMVIVGMDGDGGVDCDTLAMIAVKGQMSAKAILSWWVAQFEAAKQPAPKVNAEAEQNIQEAMDLLAERADKDRAEASKAAEMVAAARTTAPQPSDSEDELDLSSVKSMAEPTDGGKQSIEAKLNAWCDSFSKAFGRSRYTTYVPDLGLQLAVLFGDANRFVISKETAKSALLHHVLQRGAGFPLWSLATVSPQFNAPSDIIRGR